MIDDILSLERRAFLQQAAGAVALAAVSSRAGAANESHTLVLYQEWDADSVAYATAMQQKGLRTLPLGNDVVRLWRDKLQNLVLNGGYRVTGITGYADYFVLRGLAAEHRRFVEHEQQLSRDSFAWII